MTVVNHGLFSRVISDLSRKLDKGYDEASSLADLFSPRMMELRNRLLEAAFAICCDDLSETGRKAESYLWSKIYHRVAQSFKKHRKGSFPRELCAFETHLLSGIATYHNLIAVVAQRHALDVQVIFNEPDKLNPSVQSVKQPDERAQQMIHRCLTYMGDIFRYLDDAGFVDTKNQAVLWYQKAILWDSTIGLPYNQLATLSGDCNFGLDAVYFYLRCVTSQKPFEGALANLKRTLSSFKKSMKKNRGGSKESLRVVKKNIFLLHLVTDAVLFHPVEPLKLTSLIEDLVFTFREALRLPPKRNFIPSRPLYLDQGMVFKISIIVLMLMTRTRDDNIKMACFALAANVFVVLLNCVSECLDRLMSKSVPQVAEAITQDSRRHPDVIVEEELEEVNDKGDNPENDQDKIFEKEKPKDKQQKKSRKRSRRKATGSDSESELEETARRAIDVLDISTSEDEDNEDDNDDDNDDDEEDDDFDSSFNDSSPLADDEIPSKEESSKKLEGTTADYQSRRVRSPKQEDKPPPRPPSITDLSYQSHMQTVKVYCDFFSSSEEVAHLTSSLPQFSERLLDNLQPLLSRLVEIGFIPEDDVKDLLEQDILTSEETPPDEEGYRQEHPLDCDWALLHFPLLIRQACKHEKKGREEEECRRLTFLHGRRRVTEEDSVRVCILRVIYLTRLLLSGGRSKVSKKGGNDGDMNIVSKASKTRRNINNNDDKKGKKSSNKAMHTTPDFVGKEDERHQQGK